MSLRKSLLAIAALVALTGAGLATPAAAQDWGRREPGYRHGWAPPPPPPAWGEHRRWHRPRCWVEERPVRVYTPWGPRVRYQPQRVCR